MSVTNGSLKVEKDTWRIRKIRKKYPFMLHVPHAQVSAVLFWGALVIAVFLTAVITIILVARIKTKENSKSK